jgi:hypothetical protein
MRGTGCGRPVVDLAGVDYRRIGRHSQDSVWDVEPEPVASLRTGPAGAAGRVLPARCQPCRRISRRCRNRVLMISGSAVMRQSTQWRTVSCG